MNVGLCRSPHRCGAPAPPSHHRPSAIQSPKQSNIRLTVLLPGNASLLDIPSGSVLEVSETSLPLCSSSQFLMTFDSKPEFGKCVNWFVTTVLFALLFCAQFSSLSPLHYRHILYNYASTDVTLITKYYRNE